MRAKGTAKLMAVAGWLATTMFASAQQNEPLETALWKSIENWNILIDRTVQYQCFATILYEDFTVFRVGFQNPDSSAALYVALGNLNWTSIEVGKDYDLVMRIDNGTAWTSPARGFRFGEMPALVVNTNEVDFFEQLMRKHALQVFFNGQRILNLSLRGSHAAIREMIACQNEVDRYLGRRAAPPRSDPFAGASSRSNSRDPFAP